MKTFLNFLVPSNETLKKKLFDDFLIQTKRSCGGFFELEEYSNLVGECERVYKKFFHKKTFIHVGIGGSGLGPEMLIEALKKSTVDFRFISNIDPTDINRKLEHLNFENTLFYIVSKSGTTAETIAVLHIILNKLKSAGISENNWKNYIVFATDPTDGDLRKLSNEFHIEALTVPTKIGGRYSVLTPVGLFPALFAGININELIKGAKNLSDELLYKNETHEIIDLALSINQKRINGYTQTVIMPYSTILKQYSSWFVQLWAESLGKDKKGLTPIPAYGATDQHSQMQLFMEGTRDKYFLMIEVEKFEHDFELESNLQTESSKLFNGIKISDLMRAEFEGTLKAMNENSIPVARIVITKIDEFNLGYLIFWAQCLTVLSATLIEVDPFNQPGVEAGKKYAKIWLKETKN